MRLHTRSATHGFTLVEMMIVVAIIAIIASMAIPNLLSSRLTANETAAVATLKALVSAQSQAVSRDAVDIDGDGQGEYLFLAELSGTVNLRGLAVTLDPAIVSVSLGNVSNSNVNKAGYHFALYLPDAAGAGVAEDPNGGLAAPAAVDADFCESYWVAYAWPATHGSSGRRAFVVNQEGSILQTPNDAQQYSGNTTVPAFDSAYSAAGDLTSRLSVGGVPAAAADGAVWTVTN
jgi:prepilin-type N-terminal cleavage/methylation domain-containing protein